MHKDSNQKTRGSFGLRDWLYGTAALAIVFAAAGAAGPAAAQALTPGGTSADQTAPEEVTVTARRRPELLQDVPISATVILGEDVLNRLGGEINPVNVFSDVPGMRVNNTSSPGTTEYSMRGSGTARATSADSGVALYRENDFVGGGLVFGRTFLNSDLFDIGRIEILRGTQAALYGRDAVGGAIAIFDAQPEFDNEGNISEDYNETTERFETDLIENYQASDTVALRFSGQWDNESKGFFYDTTYGDYLDGGDGYIVRGQIRYKSPNSKFDGTLQLEAQNVAENAVPFQFLVQPTSSPSSSSFKSAAIPNGYYMPRYTDAWNEKETAPVDVKETAVYLSLTYDLGWATWSSSTMARFRDGYSYNDNSGGGAPLAFPAPSAAGKSDASTVDQTNNYFESMQMNGQWGNLTWLGGGDYLLVPTNENGGTTTVPVALTGNYIGQTLFSKQIWQSAAVFGSADYTLPWSFDLDAEGRYTWDYKSFRSSYGYDLPTAGQPHVPAPTAAPYFNTTFPTNFSYNIVLSWKPYEGNLLYAKIGTGYRVGGFNAVNSVPNAPVPIQPTYNDEVTTAYEVGAKETITSWFSGTFATYFNHVQGALTQDSDGCSLTNACDQNPSNFVTNAGTDYNYGVELQGTIQASLFGGSFTMSPTSSYEEGRFISGTYKYLLVPQMPKWEISDNVGYTHQIFENVTWFGNVNFYGQWKGRQDVTSYDLVGTTPGYYEPLANIGTFDFRTGVDVGDFEVALYMSNFTDDQYVVVQTPTTNKWSNRDSWGVQFKYKW